MWKYCTDGQYRWIDFKKARDVQRQAWLQSLNKKAKKK